MKQFRHNGTNNWPSILTRIALVLTSVTIIVLFYLATAADFCTIARASRGRTAP